MDAIIVAVSHDQYKLMGKKNWMKMFNSKGVFIDVKSIANKEFFFDTTIQYWQL